MKKRILYIHGLGSSSYSSSYTKMKDLFPQYEWHAIDVYHECERSLDLINKYITGNDIYAVMGTSLGGYYALACNFEGMKLVFNPAIKPHDSLKVFLGTHEYFTQRKDKHETTYTITEDSCKEFEKHLLTDKKFNENVHIILSDHDELLGDNYDECCSMCKCVRRTSSMGHRLSQKFIEEELPFMICDLMEEDF